MGRVRVLRLPLTLLLGPAPAPGVHHPGLPVGWALTGRRGLAGDRRQMTETIVSATRLKLPNTLHLRPLYSLGSQQ